MNPDEKITSTVNIKHSGKGFIIIVKDHYTENLLAVTKKELERIVLCGQGVLKETTP